MSFLSLQPSYNPSFQSGRARRATLFAARREAKNAYFPSGEETATAKKVNTFLAAFVPWAANRWPRFAFFCAQTGALCAPGRARKRPAKVGGLKSGAQSPLANWLFLFFSPWAVSSRFPRPSGAQIGARSMPNGTFRKTSALLNQFHFAPLLAESRRAPAKFPEMRRSRIANTTCFKKPRCAAARATTCAGAKFQIPANAWEPESLFSKHRPSRVAFASPEC